MRNAGVWLVVSSLFLLLVAASGAAAAADRGADRHVLNNDVSGANSITVTVFNRAADRSLTLKGSAPMGGAGNVMAFADGTQGSLIRTPDGSRLLAVDAGIDKFSVVDVDDGQP